MTDTNEAHTMMISRAFSLPAALAVALFVGPAAHAEMVSFVTTGTFLASGSSVLQDLPNGLDIRFESGNSTVDLSPGGFSNTSFGQFNTSNTTATSNQVVTSGFELSILQVAPSVDPSLLFSGSISGTISISGSSLVVQFSGPLVLTSADGRVTYTILNADLGVPGQIFVGAPDANNGLTSVNGRVTLNAIPEPSALALLGLGIPAALLYRRRVATA